MRLCMYSGKSSRSVPNAGIRNIFTVFSEPEGAPFRNVLPFDVLDLGVKDESKRITGFDE